MWSLNLERLIPLAAAEGGLGAVAIESGTCRGNGTRVLARHFPSVISIELSESLHLQAVERFAGSEFSHVKLIQGNSPDALKTILPGMDPAQPAFFFLDAHWSGDSSVSWAESEWKGYGLNTAHLGSNSRPSSREQCPLEEELRVIMEHCAGPAQILVDDMKNIPLSGAGLIGNGFPGEDWSHLSRIKLLEIVKPRLINLYELPDPLQWFLFLAPRQ